ncbi:M12 family metallopeptidase [Chitinivorax sp. B]|uniref:M12 family metallopeptidase n=1 Tax=Chitinivorax sp. B TaxID=2502235 RepID=UPI0014859A66|nr:M12 family metallopeptidase [Chitinivorax sp. B]
MKPSTRHLHTVLIFGSLISGHAFASNLPAEIQAHPLDGQVAYGYHAESGKRIPYEIRNGNAVLGDIVLGKHDEIQRKGISSLRIEPWTSSRDVQIDGIQMDNHDGSKRRWPNNTLYYSLDWASSAARNAFMQATRHITEKTGVRFVQRTNQPNYVYVTSNQSGMCYSSVGMVGGAQELSLGSGCEYLGIAAHELLHALGWDHEQNRPDRDRYVRINWNNIPTQNQHNFRATQGADPIGAYDFGSLMHYGAFDFAINRAQPTIQPLDPSRPLNQLGQRNGMSAGDVASVKHFYPSQSGGDLGISISTRQLVISKNGTGSVTIDISSSDPNSVQLAANSDNPSIIANSGLSLRKLAGNQYTLTVRPVANVNGTANIAVQANDRNGKSARTTLAVQVGSGTTTPSGNGYKLVSPYNNLCLDVAGSLSNYTKLVARACNGSNTQRWNQDGNGYIRNVANPQFCVDTNGTPAEWIDAIVYTCNNHSDQRWRRSGNALLNGNNGNVALSLTSTNNVVLYRISQGANWQSWNWIR